MENTGPVLPPQTPQDIPPVPGVVAQPPVYDVQPPKKSRRTIIIVAVVVILLVIGVMAAVIMQKKPVAKTTPADNALLGSKIKSAGDDYVQKDKSGANDQYYRKNAAEYQAIAKSFTFDTYDTTYSTTDIKLSKRVTTAITGEAKNMFMVYATLVNGGFNPYASTEVIKIQSFDIRDFPGYTSNCGPILLIIANARQDNSFPCKTTSEKFLGTVVYKGIGAGADQYSVTINNTRITITARSEQEALAVMRSMKKVPATQLDFFIKN
ncbi:MAG: hypothetical protein JWS12_773 [Candidatus Saccharibacteria bacterium]|nr:hypothetical protein [Candidatus Saccharibacteria bacterium]